MEGPEPLAGGLPHGKAPQSPCPEGYPSGTPKGEVGAGGSGQQGCQVLWWGGLCVWSCGGGSRSGALVDLLRSQGSSHHSQGLDSFTAARAKHGWGIVTLAGSSPRPAQPCHERRMPRAAAGCQEPAPERVPGPGPHTRVAATGAPCGTGFSCCLQDLISAWTSLTSCRFFLLATGMRSFGLGVLDVEKLLLGGGHAAVPGA